MLNILITTMHKQTSQIQQIKSNQIISCRDGQRLQLWIRVSNEPIIEKDLRNLRTCDFTLWGNFTYYNVTLRLFTEILNRFETTLPPTRFKD